MVGLEKHYITDNAEWMLDWDYESNSLSPDDISVGSRQRVHWKCHVCGGKWNTVVKERRGCPYCNNFKVLKGVNDLETLFPDIAKQWDYKRNNGLKPEDVTIGSQKKVFWICEKGHSWDMFIRSRTRGQGCPYCNNRRILAGYNDLATLNSELAKEWNWDKNGDLTPSDVGTGSKNRVWWKCSKGHEWQARVIQRNAGTGCPVCANRIIIKYYNDFATEHPELLTEWDYEKNEIDPSDCACFSNRKVWWICKRGHKWKAAIGDRSKGTGCPKCSEERRVSFPEKAILYYLRKHIGNVLANYRDKAISPFELDIYLPNYRLAIEYDGIYGHSKGKGIDRDIRKNQVCEKNQISLVRIREDGCPQLNSSSIDYMIKGRDGLAEAIYFIYDYLSDNYNIRIDCAKKEVDFEKDAGEIYSLIEFSEKENSILKQAPQIAKMWHPTKNGRINPEYVSVGSNRKFWWLGECGHEWMSTVSYERSSGKCPYCSGMRVLRGFNDLSTVNPMIAKEWDYEKNEKLIPEEITSGSGKKVWWKCEKGHSWNASIISRNRGNGCPICANRIALEGYNDITANEELFKSWNYKKNIELNPKEISVGSEKIVWWICPKCGFEWKAMVRRRAGGNGCPECGKRIRSANSRNKMVSERGSLADKNPSLLEEWNWDKNEISPYEILAGYTKKVWWKCKKCKNEWMATVISRNAGRGCPSCGEKSGVEARQKTLLSKKDPITFTHPEIMKDWDYENNPNLNPDFLTAGSGKRANWKCHICATKWDAVIGERTRGRGKCPKC